MIRAFRGEGVSGAVGGPGIGTDLGGAAREVVVRGAELVGPLDAGLAGLAEDPAEEGVDLVDVELPDGGAALEGLGEGAVGVAVGPEGGGEIEADAGGDGAGVVAGAELPGATVGEIGEVEVVGDVVIGGLHGLLVDGCLLYTS